jgi:O-antigen ligase/tetratricopeptide (TPR) repeat protein
METGGVKAITRWVALGALFLIPFTPLIVADTYFFPFITGKAFYFRTLVEVSLVAWGVLVFLDKEYRPRRSWIGVAVVAFVVWMFVANLFAVNVTKAFWSNFERMEGWVLLAHLLGFFFVASNVLRVEKKWRTWFLTSLGVSVLIVLYALLQLAGTFAIHQGSTRIDATFGNSAYLAIYLLFSVCIALWLALVEEQAWLKWSLVALAVVQGMLIFMTETRGTVLALLGALALAAGLTVLTAGKRARTVALAGLGLLLLVSGLFYINRDSSFVHENRILDRIASISLEGGQTRFTIWSMAFEGVLERPVFGWGQEGFNYVFNKYYDPSLYGQESWFDRAHNAFIDWLSAGGFSAFFLYIALFGTAIVLLWTHSELSRPERIALTAALAGYAFHNLFVFDNLYSYVYFFAILALIDSQVGRPTRLAELREVSENDATTYLLPVALVIGVAMIWMVNVTGMQASSRLILALSPSPEGVKGNTAIFQDLLSPPGFAAQEIREQLVSYAANVVQSNTASDEEKQSAVSLAIGEMRKQVDAYPLDARGHLQLSQIYRASGDIQGALTAIKTARDLSPTKQDMWLELGVMEWEGGNPRAAREAFYKAYELSGKRQVLAASAAAGEIAIGDLPAARALLREAYGTTTVDSDLLGAAYYRTGNWQGLIDIWRLRASRDSATAETWFSLASAYYEAGDRAGAITVLKTAAIKFPSIAPSVEEAIKQIQAGQ